MPAIRERLAPLASHVVVATVGVCLLGVALALGHFTSFYSVDGDVKYLGALNIAQHFPNLAISYPSHQFDPSGRYTLPLTAWYGGHDYAGYSLPFLLLSAAALALFGNAGLVLPPVLGAVVLLYAQLRLADLLDLTTSRVLITAVTACGTPVLFYAISFWEHSWGAGLLLAGIAVMLTALAKRLSSWTVAAGAGAGFLFAAAVLMRRDTLVPALIVIGLLVLVVRRRQAMVISGVAVAAMIVPIGLILMLHPEPLALGLTHASPGRAGIGIRSGLSWVDKLEFLLTGGWATGLVAVVLCLGLLARRFRPSLVVPLVAAGSVVSSGALVFTMLSQYSFSNENILAFCPLAVWGLMLPLIPPSTAGRAAVESATLRPQRGAASAATRTIWLLAVVGSAAVVVMASDSGGAQWGPRYLLFAFPLLILLAMKARERMLESSTSRRMVNYSFVVILALTVLVQGLGLFALTVKQGLAAKADAAIATTHSDVVISAFPVIDLLAPTYEQHEYLYAPTQADLAVLMQRLRHQGDRRLTLLCDPVDPCRWNGYTGWARGPIHRVRNSVRFAVYTVR